MCCIPVHHAALMIGSIHTFRLMGNLLLQEYTLALTEIVTTFAFLAMVFKNSKETRMYYFVSYCFYIMLINCMELYMRKNPNREEQDSKIAYFTSWCDTHIKEYGFEDMNTCRSFEEARMMRDELIFIAVQITIQIHFAMVIYAHWKNHSLPIRKGGCATELTQGNIQMNNGPLGRIKKL